MNKVFQPLLFIILTAPVQAQSYDSWKIIHNRRQEASFNNKKETADEKKVLLLNRNLEAPGYFIIEITPAKETADWIRSFAFVDSSDNQLSEYPNSPNLRISNTELSSILENRQQVKVYSWAIPKDPAVAATVRVRRILLCTLYTR